MRPTADDLHHWLIQDRDGNAIGCAFSEESYFLFRKALAQYDAARLAEDEEDGCDLQLVEKMLQPSRN
jgi:hypothetical protein